MAVLVTGSNKLRVTSAVQCSDQCTVLNQADRVRPQDSWCGFGIKWWLLCWQKNTRKNMIYLEIFLRIPLVNRSSLFLLMKVLQLAGVVTSQPIRGQYLLHWTIRESSLRGPMLTETHWHECVVISARPRMPRMGGTGAPASNSGP